MRSRHYRIAGLCLALGACAADHVDTTALAVRAAPIDRPQLAEVDVDRLLGDAPMPWDPSIVGGQPEAGHPAVALLLAVDANEQIAGICSGTLIAPARVLTAAHCIDGETPGVVGFAVYFGTELSDTDPGFIFATSAEAVVVHPRWNPDRLEDGHDIGLVFLREPAPIAPIPFRTAPLGAADISAPIDLVGWGLTGGGAGDSGVKRSAVSAIQDFDALLIDVADAAVGTCSGDSGGPAFLAGEVAGVTSFGDVDCAQLSIDTRVDAFARFIASDGQEVDDPGEAGAGFGAPCAVAADCTSGVCAISGGEGFCSELCDGGAIGDSCPEGSTCEDLGGTAACVPGGDDDGGGFPITPRDDGGCSAAGSGHAAGALWLLALVAALRRRRS
jgi:MYXO-CTERM domain-containing protein